MEIVRTKSYQRALKRLGKLGATEFQLDEMEAEIAADPQAGDVIQGTGGLRKIRFAYGEVGKSGGGRTIYYALTACGTIYLITAYAKVDKADLTPDEKRLFKKLVKELIDG